MMIESILIWLGLLGVTAVDATGDASKGPWKWWSQAILRFVPLAALLVQYYRPFSLLEIAGIGGAGVLINAGFFNPIYNKVKGNKWYYFGTKKLWDRLARKTKQHPILLQIVLIITAIVTGLGFLGFWEYFNK